MHCPRVCVMGTALMDNAATVNQALMSHKTKEQTRGTILILVHTHINQE